MGRQNLLLDNPRPPWNMLQCLEQDSMRCYVRLLQRSWILPQSRDAPDHRRSYPLTLRYPMT